MSCTVQAGCKLAGNRSRHVFPVVHLTVKFGAFAFRSNDISTTLKDQ